MTDSELRVIIIDDDTNRANRIKECLPGYAEGMICTFGNDAKKAIYPGIGGVPAGLVIMDSDDRKGIGLYVFDYIKNDCRARGLKIPVILLTEDEFSDKTLDYLEIADALFYEGEVDEDRMFSTIVEALDSVNSEEEEEEDTHESDKTIEKIIGKSVKAAQSSEDGSMRSAVINMKEHVGAIENVMEESRLKAEKSMAMISKALAEKGIDPGVLADLKPTTIFNKYKKDNGIPIDDNKEVVHIRSFEDIAKYQSGSKVDMNKSLLEMAYGGNRTETDTGRDIVGENERPSIPNPYSAETARIRQNMLDNNWLARDIASSNPLNQGIKMPNPFDSVVQGANMNNFSQPASDQPVAKKIVAIVDDDPKVLKICRLFLSRDYEVVSLQSGMKAIDYFVRNQADVLIIDVDMANLDGVKTLASIRYQSNGKNVPALFMVEGKKSIRFGGGNDRLIVGTVTKPITHNGLVTAVEEACKIGRRTGK